MKVLIACERSGVVRDAFLGGGHDALSADTSPTEMPGPHYHGDVRDLLSERWDLIIGFPPCTFLSRAGLHHLYRRSQAGIDLERLSNMKEACSLFLAIWDAGERVAIENPVMHRFAQVQLGLVPDQFIEPWQFGSQDRKKTGLFLKGLRPLVPTRITTGPYRRWVDAIGPTDRPRRRGLTYPGIARAMADQWGNPPRVRVFEDGNQTCLPF